MPQNRLFPIHHNFRDEMDVAGRILLDYGEVEIELMNCVQVRRKDLDAVLKMMFRTRGEKQRIEIADALGRIAYHEIDLGTQFEMAIADMQHCRRIRNQYAHAYWTTGEDQKLAFVGLEDLARSNVQIKDLKSIEFFYIDLPLLQQQEQFISNTLRQFTYLNYEGRFRIGELKARVFGKAPYKIERPSLHLPRA